MKIKKYKKYIETYDGDGGDDFPVTSDYTVGFVHDRIFIRTLDEHDYLVITLEPQDILKLMTWLVGQEKHIQEELTSLRKKVEVQEKPLVGIKDAYEEVREKNKENQKKLNQIRDELVDYEFGNTTVVNAYDKDIENQKIVDELLKEWKSAEDEEGGHYEHMLGNILTRATGKDIKYL